MSYAGRTMAAASWQGGCAVEGERMHGSAFTYDSVPDDTGLKRTDDTLKSAADYHLSYTESHSCRSSCAGQASLGRIPFHSPSPYSLPAIRHPADATHLSLDIGCQQFLCQHLHPLLCDGRF